MISVNPQWEISPRDAQQKLNTGAKNFILLDCREPEELQVASVAGARHIPMGDIPSRVSELDADAEIVVMCHHGRRSLQVTKFLRDRNFSNVRSMAGGIDLWSATVDPKVPVY